MARARRRRFGGWLLWALLLATSWSFQLTPREPQRLAPDQRAVLLPRMTSAGPTGGRPVRVAYRDRGAGMPVIYLHGSPGSGADGARLAALLARRFRVLLPDLPGFGASERWVPDYGIEAEARYVLSLMDELSIERAHLFSHSMGSGVAFQAARLAPQRVASIVAYGGIGIQEGEGSGDYALERIKYVAGFVALVFGPEMLPHFGLFGRFSSRYAWVRNFWDTDQRPLRGILAELATPLLIIHGRDDPLVPASTAEEHHRIVQRSELIMLEASHFMVFTSAGARRLAELALPFLERHADPLARPVRRTADLSSGPGPRRGPWRAAGPLYALGPRQQLTVLALLALPLEPLATIAAGLLARDDGLDAFVAALGCWLGLVVGDLALWGLGRAARRDRLPGEWSARIRRVGQKAARRPRWALVGSRFAPGLGGLIRCGLAAAGTGPVRFFLASVVTAAATTVLLIAAGLIVGSLLAGPLAI